MTGPDPSPSPDRAVRLNTLAGVIAAASQRLGDCLAQRGGGASARAAHWMLHRLAITALESAAQGIPPSIRDLDETCATALQEDWP